MFAEQPERMSVEAFLAWEDAQEEKHELIDGAPLPRRLRLMAGGTARHAFLGARVASALSTRLRGGACRAAASDLKVQSPTGNLRYPDALVDCGPYHPTSHIASQPAVVVEVLSPSNTGRQQLRLLADYQAIPTIAHLVFLEQEAPAAFVWSRTAGGWSTEELAGWDAVLELPAVGASLPLAEIYEDLVPRDPPPG